MTSKLKPKAEPAKARNVIQVEVFAQTDSPDDALARKLTRPEVGAAATMQLWEGGNHEVNALARELAVQIAAVKGGDLKRAEGMLISQAHTLNELFNNLARRAHGQSLLAHFETYLRLALKAQGQCRATLETLATIKNPPIIYAKQANIASGPQQINNGIPSHARETENLQNKQSEGENGLLPHTGASPLAGSVNQALEALGEIDRAEVKNG